jgi:hypothetical protein
MGLAKDKHLSRFTKFGQMRFQTQGKGPFPVAQKHGHMHDTASLKGNWHGMEMLTLNVTFP